MREVVEMSKLRPKIRKIHSSPQLQLNNRIEILEQNIKVKDRRLKSQKSDQPNFSFIQSNVLYLLFILGFFACFGGDLLMQLAKNGYVNENTKVFISIFIINIFLWIDFNLNFPNKLNSQRGQACFCETFFADSTHLIFCFIVAPVILCTRWLRSVSEAV